MRDSARISSRGTPFDSLSDRQEPVSVTVRNRAVAASGSSTTLGTASQAWRSVSGFPIQCWAMSRQLRRGVAMDFDRVRNWVIVVLGVPALFALGCIHDKRPGAEDAARLARIVEDLLARSIGNEIPDADPVAWMKLYVAQVTKESVSERYRIVSEPPIGSSASNKMVVAVLFGDVLIALGALTDYRSVRDVPMDLLLDTGEGNARLDALIQRAGARLVRFYIVDTKET